MKRRDPLPSLARWYQAPSPLGRCQCDGKHASCEAHLFHGICRKDAVRYVAIAGEEVPMCDLCAQASEQKAQVSR